MTDDQTRPALDLDTIEARIPHQYAAPWRVEAAGSGWAVAYATDHPLAGLVATVPDYGYHLARFIAAARSDIPALVAEVRRLREHEQTRAAAIARYSPIVSAARALREVWRRHPAPPIGDEDPGVTALTDAVDRAYPHGRSPTPAESHTGGTVHRAGPPLVDPGNPPPYTIPTPPAAPTPAEIDAGAEALHGDQCPEDTDDGATCTCDASHYDRAAAAVLRAVLPNRDARLREQIADYIADGSRP